MAMATKTFYSTGTSCAAGRIHSCRPRTRCYSEVGRVAPDCQFQGPAAGAVPLHTTTAAGSEHSLVGVE